jgi:transcriptional regulator with XRE-family HTH domain
MKLRDYLKSNKISARAFGDLIGVCELSMHRYVTGKRVPTASVMQKVLENTDGAVTPNDFFPQAASQ